MLKAEIVRAESGRYAATLVCLPGLWAGPAVWRRLAGYLAHRGWESRLLDLQTADGDVAARGAAVAEYVATLSGPAVLLGHDAGALVVLAAAAGARPPAAAVLLAPLLPGSAQVRVLGARRGALVPLVLGRPVPPPGATDAAPLCGELPAAEAATLLAGLRPESPAVLRDVVRGRFRPQALPGVASLVVAGERDPLLPPVAATLFARTVGADHETIPGGGHWLLGGPTWLRVVDVLHRWIVRRLGAPLLEFYPEAMAERDEAEDDAKE